MKTSMALVSASETAHVLRLALGQRRAWSDFLADCIRERADLNGLTLLPYAARAQGTDVKRPLYRASDIRRFIVAARMRDPDLRGGPPAAATYELDDAPGLPWKARLARSL